MSENIVVRGARLNNLKNIDVEIPRDKFTVITGISGSGKSTLAFDTIFAEGQRRFVESVSSFARQFLGRMSKPDADEIKGIPPAIAIEQKVNTSNPRSTVGTSTEIYEYLRLLYAKIGKTYSPVSGEEVKRDTVEDVVKYVESLDTGISVFILSPLEKGHSDTFIENLLSLKDSGFSRVWSRSGVERIDSLLSGGKGQENEYYVLVDRLINDGSEDTLSRLFDSVSSAISLNKGGTSAKDSVAVMSGNSDKLAMFSTYFERDGIIFEEPTENLFSYNNPLGACPLCSGYGKIIGVDEDLVIPDKSLSVYEEAVACWRGNIMKHFYSELIDNAHKFDFPLHTPYKDLSSENRALLWHGNKYFTGIDRFFEIIEKNKYKIQYRYMLSRYSGKTRCPECNGARLRKEALYVKVEGKNIAQLMDMSIEELYDFLSVLKLDWYRDKVSERILREITSRLSYMIDVGLPYLTLNRPSNTLSGGESQRINLVRSIGSSLVGSLYILDEPSIGLHPRDTAKLIDVLFKLRDLGNTLIVVEHDEEIMRKADMILDIGPYAGRSGGELVLKGTPGEIEEMSPDKISNSLTAKYLRGEKHIKVPGFRRSWSTSVLVKGAAENNLQNIDVEFPLRVFTAITGVSGSGKSTLVRDIFYPALKREISQFGEKPGIFSTITGDISKISSIEYIDQNPIGKSSRSNPATYLKVYDEIRRLFSEQPYAKVNKYGHSHFSFNIDGGRCPECLGEGFINIEMQFMADVKMVCESCGGKRFKPDILEVKYKGKNINDVLNMSVNEAIDFFSSQKDDIALRIARKLMPLKEVGLSYVMLGQNSSTLSGGESQRVKLASFLSRDAGNESILFIFDEPTTGLHFYDISKLMDAFNSLISRGHTVVVVEHNMDVVKSADWVIDLGPEGGKNGGKVVFAGTPEDMVVHSESYTSKALRSYLNL